MVKENNALPLEYELAYGCAKRQLSIADIVGDQVTLIQGRQDRVRRMAPTPKLSWLVVCWFCFMAVFMVVDALTLSWFVPTPTVVGWVTICGTIGIVSLSVLDMRRYLHR